MTLVVLISVLPYVFRLGFYSDDWAFLSSLTFAVDDSPAGRFEALYRAHDNAVRPVQFLVLTLLHSCFGLEPTGYHLFNASVLLMGIVFFHLALIEAGSSRVLAVAIPAVYALLPNYSTDRFWIAAFQATLSMTLFFLHVYAELRGARAGAASFWRWKGVGAVALLLAVFSYEVFIPLFVLAPLLLLYRRRGDCADPASRGGRLRIWTLYGSTLFLLLPAVALKRAWARRMAVPSNISEQLAYVYRLGKRALGISGGRRDYGLDIAAAARVHLWEYGAGFPLTVGRILRDHAEPVALVTAVVLTGVVFAYLYRLAGSEAAALSRRRTAFPLVAAGFVLFAAGYAIFLTTENVGFTATGIANRTAIAASVGIATAAVGAVACAATLAPVGKIRRTFFCAIIALWCGAGSLVITTLATFWDAAYEQELAILKGLRRDVPFLSSGSTVLLAGTCTYAGPAVVFESSWDISGALRIVYNDASLRADVVSPRLRVGHEGVSTAIYDQKQTYGYGNLFVYDAAERRSHALPDERAAERYFTSQRSAESVSCPPGKPGKGARVF